MRNEVQNTIIRKNNELIFGKLNLIPNELKLLNLAISQVKSTDFGYKYTIELRDLGNKFEKDIGRLKNLADKIIGKVIELPHSKENPNGWRKVVLVSYAEYFPDTHCIDIRFDSELVPFLIELKKNYTTYQIENILKLKSIYAIRFYEMFKKEFNSQRKKINYSATKIFKLNDLYETLGISKSMQHMSKFKERILYVMEHQINTYTDLHIEWKLLKTKRKFTDLKITIREKSVFNENAKSTDYYNKEIEKIKKFNENQISENERHIQYIFENCLNNTRIRCL